MLIQNLTTEFKDSNGILRVVWDMYYADDDRQVHFVRRIEFCLFSSDIVMMMLDNSEFIEFFTIDERAKLIDRLLAWAAPQDIETLKAKLAF